MKNQKGNTAVIAIIIVIVAITAGTVGWMFAKKSQAPVAVQPAPVVKTEPTTPVAQSVDETANWQTYTDSKFGFSFKYPVEWDANSSANDWMTNTSSSGNVISVKLVSPETKNNIKLNREYPVPTADINIKAYTSIACIVPDCSEKSKTLDEYFKDAETNYIISKLSMANINGLRAFEVVPFNSEDYYRVYIENKKEIFEINFYARKEKTELSNTESEILASLKFTK